MPAKARAWTSGIQLKDNFLTTWTILTTPHRLSEVNMHASLSEPSVPTELFSAGTRGRLVSLCQGGNVDSMTKTNKLHKSCHWWTETWKNNIIWTCQSWRRYRQSNSMSMSSWHLLFLRQHGGCSTGKKKGRISTVIQSLRERYNAVFREMKREKETFWTVVLDTINYIYSLKLVWTYLEEGGKEHL